MNRLIPSKVHDNVPGENQKPHKKTRSKLGAEIDVFLAQARDENGGTLVAGAGLGELTAYSRLVTKANLEGRRSRWPGRVDNCGKATDGENAKADPFGRPMTTSQRRHVAALEIAEDGGDVFFTGGV